MQIKELNDTLRDMSTIVSFDNLSPSEVLDFKETLELIKGFKEKSDIYLKTILESKYLKSLNEWSKILTEEDKKKNDFNILLKRRWSSYSEYFFCYKKRLLYQYDVNYGCTSMGRSELNKYELKFGSKNNLTLDIHVTVYSDRLPTSFSGSASMHVDIDLKTGEIIYKYSPRR